MKPAGIANKEALSGPEEINTYTVGALYKLLKERLLARVDQDGEASGALFELHGQSGVHLHVNHIMKQYKHNWRRMKAQ